MYEPWRGLVGSFRKIASVVVAASAVSAALLVLKPAHAAPGDLDPTFGSGGVVFTPMERASVSDLVLQPDGKIVAGGTNTVSVGNSYESRFTLARYDSRGALDATFGSDGIATGPEGGARAIGLQPDGKLVVAGNRFILERGFRNYFTVARFQPSGAVDSDFGPDGVVIGLEGGAESLAIQPDGKIVTAGTGPVVYPPFAFELARLNGNGMLDSSFGDEGILQTPLGYAAAAHDVVLQPDGKIVAAGASVPGTAPPPPPPPPAPPAPPPPGPPPLPWQMTLVRYNPNGSLDSTFGSSGIVRTALGYSAEINDLALRPDGKLVVAGQAVERIYGPRRLVLARYEPSGVLDPTFGLVTTGIDGGGGSMALQPDGMIVVTGNGVARFRPNGTRDATFGLNGVAGAENPTLAGAAVAIQPDGRIVTGGPGRSGFALNRYLVTSPTTVAAGPRVVTYGRTSTIRGLVLGGRAGVRVQIVGRTCYSLGPDRILATATTGSAGQWRARISPGSRTTLQAKVDMETTAPLDVRVRPRVGLVRLSKGRLRATVIAGHSLAGEIAVLQRSAGNHWASSKRLVLRRIGKRGVAAVISGRTFRAAAAAGRRFRVLYTELGPDLCYSAAASKPIRG
jgi:uncharacterized delta-60 repeat protein